MRSIEDIDYELTSTEYVILSLMKHYKSLEKEREKLVQEVYEREVVGKPKRGDCRCWYDKIGKKVEFCVHPQCPIHGEPKKVTPLT